MVTVVERVQLHSGEHLDYIIALVTCDLRRGT